MLLSLPLHFVPKQLVFNSVTNCLGPRKFLHSGKLYKAKSNKELYGFLFNDFLLLTQIIKPLGSSGSEKVFSPKSHLQYRMYKTVSRHPWELRRCDGIQTLWPLCAVANTNT